MELGALGTLIPVIITFVIGLLCPSPIFKRVIKVGYEVVDFGYKLFTALKPDPDGKRRIDEEEYKMLKKEFADIVTALANKNQVETK